MVLFFMLSLENLEIYKHNKQTHQKFIINNFLKMPKGKTSQCFKLFYEYFFNIHSSLVGEIITLLYTLLLWYYPAII